MLPSSKILILLISVPSIFCYLPPLQESKGVVDSGYGSVPALAQVNYALSSAAPPMPAMSYGSINVKPPPHTLAVNGSGKSSESMPATSYGSVKTVASAEAPPPPVQSPVESAATYGAALATTIAAATTAESTAPPSMAYGSIANAPVEVSASSTAAPPPPPPSMGYADVPNSAMNAKSSGDVKEASPTVASPPPAPEQSYSGDSSYGSVLNVAMNSKSGDEIKAPSSTAAPPPPSAKPAYGVDAGYGGIPSATPSKSVDVAYAAPSTTAAPTSDQAASGIDMGYGNVPNVALSAKSSGETKLAEASTVAPLTPPPNMAYGSIVNAAMNAKTSGDQQTSLPAPPAPVGYEGANAAYGKSESNSLAAQQQKATEAVTKQAPTTVKSSLAPLAGYAQYLPEKVVKPAPETGYGAYAEPSTQRSSAAAAASQSQQSVDGAKVQPPPAVPANLGYGSLSSWTDGKKDQVIEDESTAAPTQQPRGPTVATAEDTSPVEVSSVTPEQETTTVGVLIGAMGPETNDVDSSHVNLDAHLMSTSSPATSTRNPNECIDKNEYCEYWKETGECQKNAPYMKANCPVSCGTC